MKWSVVVDAGKDQSGRRKRMTKVASGTKAEAEKVVDEIARR